MLITNIFVGFVSNFAYICIEKTTKMPTVLAVCNYELEKDIVPCDCCRRGIGLF